MKVPEFADAFSIAQGDSVRAKVLLFFPSVLMTLILDETGERFVTGKRNAR